MNVPNTNHIPPARVGAGTAGLHGHITQNHQEVTPTLGLVLGPQGFLDINVLVSVIRNVHVGVMRNARPQRVCLFNCGISLTSDQLINELFPDCTRSCFFASCFTPQGW